MKKRIIPNIPEPFEVTESLQSKYDGWIAWFKNLSLRIRVITPNDTTFDLARYEHMTKVLCGSEDAILNDWPTIHQVAFVVEIDTSLPSGLTAAEPEWFIFCYKDFAFSLSEFEWTGDPEVHFLNDSGDKTLFQWKQKKEIIIYRLEMLQKQIPESP